jgi:hypothetical protein
VCGHSGLHCHTFQPRIDCTAALVQRRRQSEVARLPNLTFFPRMCAHLGFVVSGFQKHRLRLGGFVQRKKRRETRHIDTLF